MDRVFLDANVLFSAAWRADSGLLVLWDLPGVTLMTSRYAVDEASANLPDEARRRRLDDLKAKLTVAECSFETTLFPAPPGLPENDVPILLAAVGMGASHLLTGDLRHFGPLMGRRIGGAEVLRVAEYLRRRRS